MAALIIEKLLKERAQGIMHVEKKLNKMEEMSLLDMPRDRNRTDHYSIRYRFVLFSMP
jgi:hypothetical protein